MGLAQQALSLLRKLKIRRPPIPVQDIIVSLGGEVEFVEDVDWASHLDRTEGLIEVRSNLSEHRYRFAMAHSLAHWMLHSDELHYYDRNFIAEEPIDTQANTYAAALLMPEWMIRVIGREIVSYAPSKLAPYFNVSDVAMNYRLKKLGIL